MHLPKPIITPFILPQFKKDYFTRARKSERARLNPVTSKKPVEPISQISNAGSAAGPNSLTVHILSSINALARPELDPRDLLMSYSSKDNTDLIEDAYKTTQPNKIFDTTEETVEAREFLERVNMPFCKSCGSKVCTCKQRRLGNDAVYK